MNVIREFQGPYRFLSNFWPAPVLYLDDEYPSVEHAYQAAKTEDPRSRWSIREALTPADAKYKGRQIAIRPGWERMKIDVMRDLISQKFNHHELGAKLLDTGDAYLMEGNRWNDTFWGISLPTGRGCNHLGHLLMVQRHIIRHR